MEPFYAIEFLDKKDHKHLRVIRCKGREFNQYSLFLFYLRDFEFEGYDELDNAILNSLNQNQVAIFHFNHKILFKGQLEEVIKRYDLGDKTDITIQLNPFVTDDLLSDMKLGRTVFSYRKYFKAHVSKGKEFTFLNNFYMEDMENERLIFLEETMKTL